MQDPIVLFFASIAILIWPVVKLAALGAACWAGLMLAAAILGPELTGVVLALCLAVYLFY